MINPIEREFKGIESLFKRTMPNANVQRIERVQNKVLWEKYSLCKKQIEKNLHHAVERHLFHGTRTNSPALIYESDSSFDIRQSAQGMWGHGNYFAVNALYSDNYSYRLVFMGVNMKQMFAARVLTGACMDMSADRQLRFPPERTDGGSGKVRRRYDSVRGHTGGSEVYITYDNMQAYPEYLITYN